MKIVFKLFSLSLVTAFLGLFYSILQVHYFGSSRAIEIYFAAQSLVYLVTSLTQSGQLAEIYLPEFHRLNHIERGLGYKGLSIIVNRMFIWGSVLIGFILFFTPFFIDLIVPGFSSEDRSQAVLIFRILSPYLILQINISFFITVLNAEEKFGKSEALGLSNTIVNIAILMLLYPYLGVWALVISLLLGKIIEFLFYVRMIYRAGFRFSRKMSTAEFNHKGFFKIMRSTFLYVGATQVYSIVLTSGISFLPVGTLAVFKYVQNISDKVRNLFIQPFMIVFFTKYSLLLQSSKSVIKEIVKNMGIIIQISIILIIGSVLLGDFVVKYVWGSEKFKDTDIRLAYLLLIFNIVAVLINSISSVYRKMSVAHGRGEEIYLLWTGGQLVSAVVTYLLIANFGLVGMYFIIPLNALLMGIGSYWAYKRTPNSIKYDFYTKGNLFYAILFALSLIIKSYLVSIFNVENDFFVEILFFICFISLSVFPLFKLYKTLFRSNKLKTNVW